MKFKLQQLAGALALTALFTACNNDDNASAIVEGTTGDAEFFFDNGVAGDALTLGSTYTNSNGEWLTIDRLNYIVSNFVLVDENGNEFNYPKNDSYFIIDEEKGMLTAHLENIPAGNYKQVKLGIGVDRERYLQGETAQQSFWDLATAHDMTWTWSTGYKFILFEGRYKTSVNGVSKDFKVHQGSTSAVNNYRNVTLNLPSTARVRPGEMPNIHIKTNVNVLLDGTNKIKLEDNLNQAGTAADLMGGPNLIKIADNSTQLFSVDHVHNGSTGGH
jgi:hypothetical protein